MDERSAKYLTKVNHILRDAAEDLAVESTWPGCPEWIEDVYMVQVLYLLFLAYAVET